MSDYNRVTLIGRLGKDPVVRYLNNGKPVCSLSVATSESYKDKDGVKQEKTQWHRVEVFGPKAEFAGQYLKKGEKVLVEGSIEYRETEKDGVKRYFTDIKSFFVQGMGGRPSGQQAEQAPADSGPGDDLPF